MSLFGFVSKVTADVFFNPQINGLPAAYIRTKADQNGGFTKRSKKMLVMLQKSYQMNDSDKNVEIGSRTTFIWVRVKDMVWGDGSLIVPEYGDEVAVDVYRKLHVYRVSTKSDLRTPSSFGGYSTFGHEDGAKEIMTIQAVQVK
jgi:hypothetical protein